MVINLKDKIYLIAEIGLNHDGEISKAKRLIDSAKDSGFDAVKFQLRSKNEFCFNHKPGQRDLGSEIVDEYISRTFIEFKDYKIIYQYALDSGIDCFFSVWDFESLEFSLNLNPKPSIYKVASADLCNFILLEKLCATNAHLILSTGMSSQEEIDETIKYLNNHSADYSLLHCHSAYPAPIHHINLKYIKSLLKIKGPKNIGYSSHDIGNVASIMAISLGAKIIEKHITIDKEGYGNDKLVSLKENEMYLFVKQCREAFTHSTSPDISIRNIGPGEKANKISLSKSVKVKRDFIKGNCLSVEDIEFATSGEGLRILDVYKNFGTPLLDDCKKGNLIMKTHFFEENKTQNNIISEIGIPVRYRDFRKLSNRFHTKYYEFHLTADDIDFKLEENFKTKIFGDNIIGFHTPDIYRGNLIFDPFSKCSKSANDSINNLTQVCKHIMNHKSYLWPNQESVKLVCSFSSFSNDNFDDKLKGNYALIAELIDEFLDIFPKISILPQLLPSRAWYLGGQRFVNTFSDPKEVFEFCSKYKKNICLDTSHLIMSVNNYKYSFKKECRKLLPFSKHFHIANAMGIDDEGLSLVDANQEFLNCLKEYILPKVLTEESTAICETWQGHLNNGQGFASDLNILNSLILD